MFHDAGRFGQPPMDNHQEQQAYVATTISEAASTSSLAPGPIFTPPGAPTGGPESTFTCDYSAMKGFSACSSSSDRTCWLKSPGKNYTIFTDYEADAPIGVKRFYEFDVTDDTDINVDGMGFPNAKLFNRKFPGTWVQGCWGDVSRPPLTRVCIAQQMLTYIRKFT